VNKAEQRLAELLREAAPTPRGVSVDDVARVRRRRRRFAAMTAAGGVAVVAAVVAGAVQLATGPREQGSPAAGPSDLPSPSGCLPSRLHVSSHQVVAGSTVQVFSGPFACEGRYPAGKTYTLVLAQVGRAAPIRLGARPVHRDGSFRALVRIPVDASPGESFIQAHGTLFDRPCRDTVTGQASCAGYSVGISVLPSKAATSPTRNAGSPHTTTPG
jgi:hypothetical protein